MTCEISFEQFQFQNKVFDVSPIGICFHLCYIKCLSVQGDSVKMTCFTTIAEGGVGE